MKKIVLGIITLIFSFSLIVFPVNAVGAESVKEEPALPLSLTDIDENFDDMENVTIESRQGDVEYGNGNWTSYFVGENGRIGISDDPTNSGMGKVMMINNAPVGTYLHAGYRKDYNVRNFTCTFDFYFRDGSETSWIGLYARLKEPGHGMEHSKTLFLLMQKGKGVSTDRVRESYDSDATRPANKSDQFYQFQPMYCNGLGGFGHMRDEFTDKTKDHGRFYSVGGGRIQDKWISVKYEVRGDHYYLYMKNKEDTTYTSLGSAYIKDSNGINSGTIAIGTCSGNYLVDNFKVINHDKNPINVTSLEGPEAGKAFSYQDTAGDKAEIDLMMQLNEGYTYGKWYTDAEKTNPVVPKRIKIEKFTLNEKFSLYEWKDYDEYDLDLQTFEDLDKPSPYGDGTTIKEHFIGNKYRLVVTCDREVNGNDYFGEIGKRSYDNEFVLSDYADGTITVNSIELQEDVYRYPSMQTVHLKAIPDEGKVFAGWYEIIQTEENEYRIRLSANADFDYTTKIGGVKIVAVFVDEGTEQFTVTMGVKMRDDENSDEVFGEIVAGDGTFYAGEDISLIASEKPGYSFYYWEIDGERIDDISKYNIIVEKDLDVTAVFEIEKYRVNIDDGFGGEYTRVVSADSEVRLVAPVAPEGYTFSRWIITGIASEIDPDVERSAIFIASNKNIFAKAVYIPKVYTVKANVENIDYGIIKGKGEYNCGALVKIRVLPKDGYTVSKYIVRGTELTLDEEGNCSFIMPSNDVMIKVQFTVIDKVETKKEITTYAIFGTFIVLIIGAFLFLKNKTKKEEEASKVVARKVLREERKIANEQNSTRDDNQSNSEKDDRK